MGMRIDDPRHQREAVRRDRLGTRADVLADRDDLAGVDRKACAIGNAAEAIQYQRIVDHQVMHHRPSFRPAPTASITDARSDEHTSELQSLMRISYAVFCLKKKKTSDDISITTASTQEKSIH